MFLKFWKKEFTEKRAHERIQKYLDIQLHHNNSLYSGLVTNLSEKGLYFITGADFYSGANLEIAIPLKKDEFKVPVIIRRIKKTGTLYDEFGGDILNHSKDYVELVNTLRSST